MLFNEFNSQQFYFSARLLIAYSCFPPIMQSDFMAALQLANKSKQYSVIKSSF